MRNTIRSLIASPGFTVIGLSWRSVSAPPPPSFSVVNAVLLRPLTYPSADRIVQVWTTSAEGMRMGTARPTSCAFQQRTQTAPSDWPAR